MDILESQTDTGLLSTHTWFQCW